MKLTILALTASLISNVAAHTYVWGVDINGKSLGRGDAEGSYIRKIYNNDPVKDLTSPDMTCNRNKGPAAKTVDLRGGDQVTIIWAHNNKDDDIVADSHKGPVQLYLAPTASQGKGPVWVKIASEGFSNGTWATDQLIKNKGRQGFVFPSLKEGEYLLRPEIVALHEGDRIGGAQVYMACVQVRVTGSKGGKDLPSPGLAFPGAYSKNDPGIYFNVYKKPIEAYIPPGGKVRYIN